MSEEQKEDNPIGPYLESPKAFHLEMPLYHKIFLGSAGVERKVFDWLSYDKTIDVYCTKCEKESVFEAEEGEFHSLYSDWKTKKFGFVRCVYRCTRDNSHRYYTFYFRVKDFIEKIGQMPSVADFQIPQVEKYRKILDKQQYQELTRGIGLAAHGVGIGSFVYLRRIFEDLIEEAHGKAVIAGGFDEAVYRKERMDEKIQRLHEYLPEFLVENKNLYSIMSKGIHELSEEECRKYFESVRIGIEQILDEKIEKEERLAKAIKARATVQVLSQEIGK
jgi:hypothetical protein